MSTDQTPAPAITPERAQAITAAWTEAGAQEGMAIDSLGLALVSVEDLERILEERRRLRDRRAVDELLAIAESVQAVDSLMETLDGYREAFAAMAVDRRIAQAAETLRGAQAVDERRQMIEELLDQIDGSITFGQPTGTITLKTEGGELAVEVPTPLAWWAYMLADVRNKRPRR
ncbi:hypothetical protein D3C72_830090 [compost metagenome]